MGLLNIICSLYLFFSQQAFSLTLRTQFVLTLAPCFLLLKASSFVFVLEDDPLCLCVDVCAGGAADSMLHSLPPRTLKACPRAQ